MLLLLLLFIRNYWRYFLTLHRNILHYFVLWISDLREHLMLEQHPFGSPTFAIRLASRFLLNLLLLLLLLDRLLQLLLLLLLLLHHRKPLLLLLLLQKQLLLHILLTIEMWVWNIKTVREIRILWLLLI